MAQKLPPEEVAELMKFLAEKTKNVTSPMSIRGLCRKFQEETGSDLLEDCLHYRISTYREKIPEITDFDMKTKVKMLFALSAPIDEEFLKKLQKSAHVEVDEEQRITKYNGKGLVLSGKHKIMHTLRKPDREDRNYSMLELLAEKAKTVELPITDVDFVREFKAASGSLNSVMTLRNIYDRMKKEIWRCNEWDRNTRVRMLFISNTRLAGGILSELRKEADVTVDHQRRITKYEAFDESLDLEGEHGYFANRPIPESSGSDEEYSDEDWGRENMTDAERKRARRSNQPVPPRRSSDSDKGRKRSLSDSKPATEEKKIKIEPVEEEE